MRGLHNVLDAIENENTLQLSCTLILMYILNIVLYKI